MLLVILFSLKTMESFANELQPHSGVTPLFFDENSIASIIAALMLMLGLNGPEVERFGECLVKLVFGLLFKSLLYLS